MASRPAAPRTRRFFVLDVRSGEHHRRAHSARVGKPRHIGRRNDKGLTYNQLRALPPDAADAEKYKDSSAYYLRVGDAASKARAIFARS